VTEIDKLLERGKLHMEQLMLDERIKKLVLHVADHAFEQGHVRSENQCSCNGCREAMKEVFPEKF
jgi:hypothetical protein